MTHFDSFFSDEGTSENSFFYLERCRSVQEHDDLITSLVPSPDKLITCSYDRSVVVLEKESLKMVTKINEAHDDLISNLDVNSANFDLIGTAGNDGTVQLWDLRQCETSQSCKSYFTVFENHRKSLIQHCERSELRLHFEWTKVN